MTNMTEFLCLLVRWCTRRPDWVDVDVDRLHPGPGVNQQVRMYAAGGNPDLPEGLRFSTVSLFTGAAHVFRSGARGKGRQEALSRDLAELAGDCGR